MKTSRYFALISLLAASAAPLQSCSSGDENTGKKATVHNVFLTAPSSTGLAPTKDYAAVVQESRTISTGFKTAGQIERVYAKEGDYVRQGQLLAELDNADYKLAVEQLQIQVDQKKSEMKRKEQLHASKNMSDNEYEMSLAALRQLEVQLALNKNKLEYTRLYAPASGYIVKRNYEKSETVNTGTAVFELMDDSALEVVVDLPVNEYINRDKFKSFTGRTSVNPDVEIPLTMISLTPKADNNLLYQLKLGVPAANRSALTSGMNLTVTVEHSGATGSESVSIPMRAVFNDGDEVFVWVFNPSDSTVARRKVSLTPKSDEGIVEVTSGLDGSEQIVAAGVHVLNDGEKVTVIEENSKTNVGNLL